MDGGVTMTMTLSGSGTIAGLVAGGLPDATGTSSDLASNAVDSQTLSLFNATGSAPVYACRAWVNFNGTGTVAIRASGNVSSITDNGTGDYTVNFTTAMPDANYSTNCDTNNSIGDTNRPVVAINHDNNVVNTSIRTVGVWNNNTFVDCSVVTAAIFR